MIHELESIAKGPAFAQDEFFEKHGSDKTFVDLLLPVMYEENMQIVVSRLILKYLKNRGELTHKQLDYILDNLLRLEHWVPILYHLQMLDYIEKPSQKKLILIDDFIRKQLTNENKYVKAWAFQAFSRLSHFEPGFREELILLCQESYHKNSAAVQARIRSIFKANKRDLDGLNWLGR